MLHNHLKLKQKFHSYNNRKPQSSQINGAAQIYFGPMEQNPSTFMKLNHSENFFNSVSFPMPLNRSNTNLLSIAHSLMKNYRICKPIIIIRTKTAISQFISRLKAIDEGTITRMVLQLFITIRRCLAYSVVIIFVFNIIADQNCT